MQCKRKVTGRIILRCPDPALSYFSNPRNHNGFHGATVSEITRRAGLNLASINYYFRDKGGALFGSPATRHAGGSGWHCLDSRTGQRLSTSRWLAALESQFQTRSFPNVSNCTRHV